MTSTTHQLWFAVVAGTAAAVFVLAFVSPVEMVESDPAVALLAAQALVEHRTLSLDVYRDHPDLAYDLDDDRRLRRKSGEPHYYSVGVPLTFAPAVWLCNRVGLDMTQQPVEYAVQNLLSALLCAAIFVLLVALGRRSLAPADSYAIALVFTFATPIVSTLATALWNTGPQTLLLCLVLIILLGGLGGPGSTKGRIALAGLLAIAFLVRPTTAFLGLAILVLETRIPWRHRLAVVGLAAAGVAALSALPLMPGVRAYYSIAKLETVTPLPTGLYGCLLSPSRGLLLLSPFLLVVAFWVARNRRAVIAVPVGRVVCGWIALHVLAISVRRYWWGGHCFGPRLLTELIPGLLVLTILVWPTVPPRSRRWTAALFLALAVPAAAVHSGVGLWNTATKRWNVDPDVDAHHELLWSWRWPQVLASDASINERSAHLQRRRQGVYVPGLPLSFDSPDLVFGGWYGPEPGWRWSRGRSPWLEVRLGPVDRSRAYRLRLVVGANGRQTVEVTINGRRAGVLHLEGFAPQTEVLVIPGQDLVPDAANRIGLEIPGAVPLATDGRVLGIAFRELRLEPPPENHGARSR